MTKHLSFINTPIVNILKDVISSTASLSKGIENYPISEYVLQSVFLKMTGFQEQKLKCILWDLANDDFDFRYDYTNDKYKLGECSSYDDKNKVYKIIINLIKKHNDKFVIEPSTKDLIFDELNSEITNSLLNFDSPFKLMLSHPELVSISKIIPKEQFLFDTFIFQSVLKNRYDLLHYHRNLCAHNTTSFQDNLPSLKKLSSESIIFDNYFTRFVILVLLDKIFTFLFNEYQKLLVESRY